MTSAQIALMIAVMVFIECHLPLSNSQPSGWSLMQSSAPLARPSGRFPLCSLRLERTGGPFPSQFEVDLHLPGFTSQCNKTPQDPTRRQGLTPTPRTYPLPPIPYLLPLISASAPPESPQDC
jgi:hypothetical protein